MSFNFKSYTANNPLLQEVEESSNLDELRYWNQVNNIARQKFGEFGFTSLSDDEMSNIVDIKKANALAKKYYGEFGFSSLSEDQMKYIVNKHPEILKVSEEVTVSSSGVETKGISEDIDIWQMAGDHLEAFRSELASAHAMASQSGQREWVSALNKFALRLDALEGAMAEANAKLGVLPTK